VWSIFENVEEIAIKFDILSVPQLFLFYFLIGIVGGGVQLRPLGTAANCSPIVSAPADYDDGGIGGILTARGNLITRRKPAPSVALSVKNPTHFLDANPGCRVGNFF
jgi:hypothetical protein